VQAQAAASQQAGAAAQLATQGFQSLANAYKEYDASQKKEAASQPAQTDSAAQAQTSQPTNFSSSQSISVPAEAPPSDDTGSSGGGGVLDIFDIF